MRQLKPLEMDGFLLGCTGRKTHAGNGDTRYSLCNISPQLSIKNLTL